MYRIIQKRHKDNSDYDYVFGDFKSFYEIVNTLTYSLFGRYRIKVVTDSIEDTVNFIKNETRYDSLDISIFMPESAIDYITQRNTNINVYGIQKMIDVFKELVTKKGILFEKDVIYSLYNSIPHNVTAMETALASIIQEYGNDKAISEKMLSKLFVLNKIVYPRTVLLSFIYMERWRWTKFEKSIAAVGNDALLGAMIKNMKQFMKDKVSYYKTGRTTQLIKSLNTNNLILMYRVLVAERVGLDDARLLLTLYERGLSSYDIIQSKKD